LARLRFGFCVILCFPFQAVHVSLFRDLHKILDTLED
jgi:hypothetical protein